MIVTHLLLGPLLLVLSIVFKVFPPKKINGLYGYRTVRSMKSQEAWEFSNDYAFKLMLWVAITTCIVQLGLYLTISAANAVLYTCVYMCIALVAIIPMTERQLKGRFGDQSKEE